MHFSHYEILVFPRSLLPFCPLLLHLSWMLKMGNVTGLAWYKYPFIELYDFRCHQNQSIFNKTVLYSMAILSRHMLNALLARNILVTHHSGAIFIHTHWMDGDYIELVVCYYCCFLTFISHILCNIWFILVFFYIFIFVWKIKLGAK